MIDLTKWERSELLQWKLRQHCQTKAGNNGQEKKIFDILLL